MSASCELATPLGSPYHVQASGAPAAHSRHWWRQAPDLASSPPPAANDPERTCMMSRSPRPHIAYKCREADLPSDFVRDMGATMPAKPRIVPTLLAATSCIISFIAIYLALYFSGPLTPAPVTSSKILWLAGLWIVIISGLISAYFAYRGSWLVVVPLGLQVALIFLASLRPAAW